MPLTTTAAPFPPSAATRVAVPAITSALPSPSKSPTPSVTPSRSPPNTEYAAIRFVLAPSNTAT